MAFELPPLPYAYEALEAAIDKKTMELHHDKHHGAYVSNLNAALEKHPEWQNKTLEEICREIADECFERLGFQRGVAGDGLVEVVHIRLVMAVVMDLHRQRVKVGFEGCLVIGQGREFVCHNFPWLWFVVKLLAANCVSGE